MDAVISVIGKNGVIILFGILIFIIIYKNSVKLFQWVEDQTFGTRDYILDKLSQMFIEFDPSKITMLLLLISFGQGVVAFGVLTIMGHWFIGLIFAFLFGFIGWKIPKPLVNFMFDRRVKRFQGQLVDGLQLLGNGLTAGLSLPQSIGMVVDELSPPISQEFNLILQQNKIGVPLEDCFENLLKRIPTEDNEMFVSSVNILRETGGNLPETFRTIVSVIRERIRVQQKIDTYIAQGKMQGIMLFLMPFAMAMIFYSMNPEGMTKAITSPFGIIMMLVALLLDLAGAYVIYKIINIEV